MSDSQGTETTFTVHIKCPLPSEGFKDITSWRASIRRAADAIVSHCKGLAEAARQGFGISPPLSESLRCERNGAHMLIENLATALKKLPRGDFDLQLAMNDAKAAFAELLEEIDGIAKNLPEKIYSAISAAAIKASDVAERCCNLTIGVSGASEDISSQEYVTRINKYVRDLKDALRDLSTSVHMAEHHLEHPPLAETPPKVRRPRVRSGLKGRKTAMMARQLKVFKDFLSARRYDGNERRLIALATQCWNENASKWEKHKNAKGSEKGYSSPKVLADAYRKAQ